MGKRKFDSENRTFKNGREAEFMFTYISGRRVCLICSAKVSVIREYNVKRDDETNLVGKPDFQAFLKHALILNLYNF